MGRNSDVSAKTNTLKWAPKNQSFVALLMVAQRPNKDIAMQERWRKCKKKEQVREEERWQIKNNKKTKSRKMLI